MTNVFLQVHFMLSHRLKGKRSLRRRQDFHSTPSLILRRRSEPLSIFGGESMSPKQKDSGFGIIFTHVLFAKGEKVVRKGLISNSKYPFLAIHAKGGESISPNQKDRTTLILNFKTNDFQLVNFKLVSYWVQKGEKVVFSKLIS